MSVSKYENYSVLIVYGVAMMDNMQVKHIRTSNKEEFAVLRSSKYLQSDTGNTYQMVEQDLKEGKTVLYSGTPCQIDGLRHFLGKPYILSYIQSLFDGHTIE